MLYFTSDLHLGHENAIQYTDRPFESLKEMNETLLQNINDVVGLKDELWILGDFAYRLTRDEVRYWRKRIRCRNVHLVRGNHDKDYSQDSIFQSTQYYKELKTEYGRCVLFHYPILEWNAAHYGSIHLHGHIHSTGDYNKRNLQRKLKERFPDGHSVEDVDITQRVYDVGVDANEYRPISIEELAAYMNLKRVK